MSVLHHESLLETIYEEVLDEYFPQYDEEQCESIARQRFEDLCQWTALNQSLKTIKNTR